MKWHFDWVLKWLYSFTVGIEEEEESSGRWRILTNWQTARKILRTDFDTLILNRTDIWSVILCGLSGSLTTWSNIIFVYYCCNSRRDEPRMQLLTKTGIHPKSTTKSTGRKVSIQLFFLVEMGGGVTNPQTWRPSQCTSTPQHEF